jgi:hypothetical protein
LAKKQRTATIAAVARACQVTFQGLDGVRHTVSVEADSVYEAACLAIRTLRRAGFVEQQPGAATKFEVQVLEPVITHAVTVGQVQRWLELGSSNPNELNRRKRLRQMLEMGEPKPGGSSRET